MAAGALALLASAAGAIEVTSPADNAIAGDGLCTLREAINNANLAAGGDTTGGDCAGGAAGGDVITFSAVTDGVPIVLTGPAGEDANLGGDLDVDDALALHGNGVALTILDGGGVDRVLHIHPDDSGHTELSGLTVRNGAVTGDGGGIDHTSGVPTSLTLDRCHVGPNSATGHGGGLRVSNGAQTTLTIGYTTIAGNSAGLQGGGILLGIGGPSTVFLYESTISGNEAISGAGIRNVAGGGGVHHVFDTTISGNLATGDGGGILDGAANEVWNLASTTITANEADSDRDGGGTGGGLRINGLLSVRNTILGGNLNVLGGEADCGTGTDLVSFGYNLIEDDAECNVSGDTTGNMTGLAPGLGPLAANGGPTLTHAVLPASPALDGGNPGGCVDTLGGPLTIDQRGEPREVDGDGDGVAVCDVGAYELSLAVLAVPGLGTPGLIALALLLAGVAMVALRAR